MTVHALLFALLTASNASFTSCGAFTFLSNTPTWNGRCHHTSQTSFKATSGGDNAADTGIANAITTTYETTLAADQDTKQTTSSRLRRILRKDVDAHKAKPYRFTYDYDELVIGSTSKSSATTAIMLIHPIGVGIGKWYYNRLLHSVQERYGDIEHRLVFLSPDLLGSATASGPVDGENGDEILKIPLLNITDWTGQITKLMAEYEINSEGEGHPISSWSVVANGGCAPIALRVASDSKQKNAPFKASLTNVIISSPPRLPFFLNSSTDSTKVKKSYRTLSGITGKLFWWYSLKKDGKFIQKFSERNLVGDAANLGEEWTPNCLAAARLYNGRSRYSTFAFLAGTLQDGCLESLNALKGANVSIDFIRGADKRRNRARSWFWTRKKKASDSDTESSDTGTDNDNASTDDEEEETIQHYVYNNGNRGSEIFIGGRISLAWEDSDGYAKGLMELLCE